MLYICFVLHTLCRCSSLYNSKSCTSVTWIKDQTTPRTFHSTNSCEMVFNSVVFSLLQRWRWVTWAGLNWAVLNSRRQLCVHLFITQYLNMASRALPTTLMSLWSEEIVEKWSLATFLITFEIIDPILQSWFESGIFDFASTVWTLLKELPPRKKWKAV